MPFAFGFGTKELVAVRGERGQGQVYIAGLAIGAEGRAGSLRQKRSAAPEAAEQIGESIFKWPAF